MFKRKTSTYLVQIKSVNPIGMLHAMIARCPVEINASGVNRGVSHVRFRCSSDDNVALNIALEIAAGRDFRLTTGYGVNEREVQQ